MTRIDWQKERHRLAALYAGMEEAELEQIATEAQSLTAVAKETLRTEMARRGMTFAAKTAKAGLTAPDKPDPPKPVMIR